MSPSPLSHKLTRSFGALLALLLFLVAFSMFNFHSLSEANKLNIHTYQVITNALQLEQTLFAVDSGARGFIITGDKGALQSYRSQLKTYDERWQLLFKLTSDNPSQSATLQELDARKKEWVSSLLEVGIAERQKTSDPNQQLLLAARSTPARRAAVKDLQNITDRIIAAENRLLFDRSKEQQRLKSWTQFTLLTGSAFSVILTGILVVVASRSARHLDQTNALLGDAKIRAEDTNARLLQINEQLVSEVKARRTSDEKLRRSVLDLQRSNAELEQFAYVASHDLQEPLRAVAGCVQVLQRRYAGKIDERADQFIQHAVDGALRMQNLINDLLAYSRAGSQQKALEVVEGTQIVEAALQSVSVARGETGAQITSDKMPRLICDPGQIEQVLQNLLSNALKFRGEAPPRIHIGYAVQSENHKKYHVLSVEDDGVGIEPQYFERIFVMFQRLQSRAEYPGTGIGLAICKKIIDRHGGKIWVESRRADATQEGASHRFDHGSKFAFSLPFEPQSELDEPKNELEMANSGSPPGEESEAQRSGAETASDNGASRS